MDLRAAEHSHEGVAREALDRPAVPLGDRAADVREARQQVVRGLRVQPPGRGGEVGGHHGHEPPRGALRVGRHLVRRPALSARRPGRHLARRPALDPRRPGRHLAVGRPALGPRWPRRRVVGRRERGVLGEDRALERAQPLARLDPQFVHERAPRVLVGAEGVGLAVAAVQREHQLRPQALAVRILGHEALEVADDLRVAAEREAGLGELLERRGPQVLQPGDLALRERLEGEVGERPAVP